MFKPEFRKKIKLSARLEGDPKDGTAKFDIAWIEDHADFKNKKNLDNRVKTIEGCKEWTDFENPIKSNEAKVEAESTVPHDTWGSDTTAKEIYACIRAEYKFIVKDGYEKIDSRVGSQGIDHLFVKDNERAIVVESKTVSDLARVKGLIKENKNGQPPNAILGVLGKGRQVGTDKKKQQFLFATQMSKKWVLDCLKDLHDKSSGAKAKQVEGVMTAMQSANPPHRVVNIYGGLDWNASNVYDKLVSEAEAQFAKLDESARPKTTDRTLSDVTASKYARGKDTPTGKAQLLYLDGKWLSLDPERGQFYLLPGKYQLRVRAEQFTGLKGDAQQVDFADEKYRDDEFFYIDKCEEKVLEEFEKPKPWEPSKPEQATPAPAAAKGAKSKKLKVDKGSKAKK